MSERRRQIIDELRQSKEEREAFVESEIDVGIPMQIFAMREDRGWTQKELGERTGQQQAVISRAERPNYGRYTLATLQKFAAAFDVGLMVRFVPFSTLIDSATDIPSEALAVPSFAEDPGLVDLGSDGLAVDALADIP